jgi:hypothetical protein
MSNATAELTEDNETQTEEEQPSPMDTDKLLEPMEMQPSHQLCSTN